MTGSEWQYLNKQHFHHGDNRWAQLRLARTHLEDFLDLLARLKSDFEVF